MILFDIETEPGSREIIAAAMPEEIKNPVMPEAIALPEPVDLSKCPAYKGDAVQQEAWREKKNKEWTAKTENAKAVWKAKVLDAQTKFFRDAALDPVTGFIRMIALRDTLSDETIAFVFDADEGRIKALTEKGAFKASVQLSIFATEVAMIRAFLKALEEKMNAERALENSAKCVGYYIKKFDFPFIYRRAWINGAAIRPLYRKGRYWSEEVIDLDEEWTLFNNQEKTGGLDRLAEVLKCSGAKLGDGAGFSDWYQRNPVEGVQYGLNDVFVTEECAVKIGIE